MDGSIGRRRRTLAGEVELAAGAPAPKGLSRDELPDHALASDCHR